MSNLLEPSNDIKQFARDLAEKLDCQVADYNQKIILTKAIDGPLRIEFDCIEKLIFFSYRGSTSSKESVISDMVDIKAEFNWDTNHALIIMEGVIQGLIKNHENTQE